MKAELNARGQLTVLASNGLEEYALQRWFDAWQERKATLYVQVGETPAPEGGVGPPLMRIDVP